MDSMDIDQGDMPRITKQNREEVARLKFDAMKAKLELEKSEQQIKVAVAKKNLALAEQEIEDPSIAVRSQLAHLVVADSFQSLGSSVLLTTWVAWLASRGGFCPLRRLDLSTQHGHRGLGRRRREWPEGLCRRRRRESSAAWR